MGSTSRREIIIELSDPDQLFTAQQISPTSPLYSEYTAQPAMDTVRDMLLHRQPRRNQDVELVVVLPPDRITPGLQSELTTAVRRWVRVQNTVDVDSTEAGGAIGRRLLLLGIAAFMVMQLTSIVVKNSGNDSDAYLIEAIGEGLSVTSWVLLWFPVQLITMEVWKSSIRRSRMKVIERVTVRVEPQDD